MCGGGEEAGPGWEEAAGDLLSTDRARQGHTQLYSTMVSPSPSWLLSLLLLHTAGASLMSRIGLRLGAAHLKKSALEHKPRTPWAVRNMKEELLANERKPWQPPKQSKNNNNRGENWKITLCLFPARPQF